MAGRKQTKKNDVKKITLNKNNWWMKKSSAGRNPKFKNPDELLQSCLEYIEFTSNRTMDEQHWVGKEGNEVTKYHPVPLTITGMLIFIDIVHSTWLEYKKNKGEGFSKVCTYVENIIYTQKFEGASTGFFNHAIIARDLGLVDKKDLTTDGKKIDNVITQIEVIHSKKTD